MRKNMDGGDNDGLRCLRDSNNFRWASKNSHTSTPREITVKRVHVEAKLFLGVMSLCGHKQLGGRWDVLPSIGI